MGWPRRNDKTDIARIDHGEGAESPDEKEVFEEIRSYFGTEEWAKEHEDNKISRMNVMWVDTKGIVRPSANSVSVNRVLHRELKIGTRSLFSYATGYYNPVTGEGVDQDGTSGIILQRNSCGCVPYVNFDFCRNGSSSEFDYDNVQCMKCHFPQLRDCIPLTRTSSKGVAARRIAARKKAAEELDNLKDGDFIAFETGDYAKKQKDGGGSTHGFGVGRLIMKLGDDPYFVAKNGGARSRTQQKHSAGDRLLKLRLYERSETKQRTFTYSERVYFLNASVKTYLGKVELEEIPNPHNKPSGLYRNLTVSQLDDLALWKAWTPKFTISRQLESSLNRKVSH